CRFGLPPPPESGACESARWPRRRLSGSSAMIAIQEIEDDSFLALLDRGVEAAVARIVLRCFPECVDRILVIPLRLDRVGEAAPGARAPEFEVGPRLAGLPRPSPVPCPQHARSLAAKQRESCLPFREQ